MVLEVTKIVHIPDNRDTYLQKSYVEEQWERCYPLIPLIVLDRTQTKVDSLYQEAPDRRFRWDDGFRIRAYIDHQPSKKVLGKFGLENERQLLVQVTTLGLDRLNLLQPNETFLIGSLVQFDGDYFQINDQVRGKDGYWANTNIPLTMNLGCDRYRTGR